MWGNLGAFAMTRCGGWSLQFKFIVDGDWRYDPWLPIARDEIGNLNNVLEVKDQQTCYELPLDFDLPESPSALSVLAHHPA